MCCGLGPRVLRLGVPKKRGRGMQLWGLHVVTQVAGLLPSMQDVEKKHISEPQDRNRGTIIPAYVGFEDQNHGT